MSSLIERLYELLTPTVEGMGFILWGIEYLPQGKHSLLRIYIDNEDGITLEHCEAVSRQVSGILDVEDLIKAHYSLEVSSPGMDRMLFFPKQYRHYCGDMVAVRLHTPVNGQKKFKGKLLSVNEQGIELEVNAQAVAIAFDNIDKANIIPNF
jgi:ribosome maturation factor RimP